MALTNSQRRYRKEKVYHLPLDFYPSDNDILAHLGEVRRGGEGMATYIKRLIREDMEKN